MACFAIGRERQLSEEGIASAIDPADLFWDSPETSAEHTTERPDSIGEVLQSLAETSARCRHLSERASARSLSATRPDHPGALSSHRASGLRTPEPGSTDVVRLGSGRGPRPPTLSQRDLIAAALRRPK